MTREHLEAEWIRCAPWIDAALEAGGRTHSLDDVLRLILDRGDTFWFWPGERAAGVTEIIRHPRMNELRYWLAGGDMAELFDAMPAVEAHAVLAGCTRFSVFGRHEWTRVLKPRGYTQVANLVWKELS